MKPEPHPEVVNRHPSTLIVGWGHVGQAIGKYFPEAWNVDVDGSIRKASGIADWNAPEIFDIGFYCVPTPACPTGECDLFYLAQAVDSWHGRAKAWCIKSTVEIGTTAKIERACFSPEFYGETLGHTFSSLRRDPFVILGGPPEITKIFATAWSTVLTAEARIFQTDPWTAELMKLMENSFLATKVSFCNAFYDLAEAAGVDWNELRELWLLDPRVGRSHTFVYPENRGFGGKCLPKDIANLCRWARKEGTPSGFMEFILEYNQAIRNG